MLRILWINNSGGGFADYVEVDEGWTAYSIALARKRDGLAEGLAFRHESVYREVQEAEADFTASGCNRP